MSRRANDKYGGPSWVDRAAARAVTAFAARMMIFELTESLAKGGHAAAKRVHWRDGGFERDDQVTEEVWDAIETFTGTAGKRGFAIRLFNRFVIIQLAC